MLTKDNVQTLIKQVFPEKSFREHQFEIISETVQYFLQGGTNVILDLPTGLGKSVIAYTIAHVMREINKEPEDGSQLRVTTEPTGPFSVVLTKTKVLQHQYSKTFPEAKSLWSSEHYDCSKSPGSYIKYGRYGCDKKLCSKYRDCQYVSSKADFIHADFGILNYHFFLTLYRLSKSTYANRATVRVFDECHDIEPTICSFFETRVSFNFVIELLEIINQLVGVEQLKGKFKLPKEMDDQFFQIINLQSFFTAENTTESLIFAGLKLINLIIESAITLTDYIIRINEHLLSKIKNSSVDTISVGGVSLRKIVSVNRECEFISGNINEYTMERHKKSWVTYVDPSVKTVLLKPVSAKKYFGTMLSTSRYNLFMSATICGVDEFASELGIEKYHYISRPSPFPVENRKVNLVGLPGLNNRNKLQNLPLYSSKLSSIMRDHTNDRGVVHTVSYDIAEYLYQNASIQDRKRMVLLQRRDVMNINDILSSSANTVVLSPSIMEGVDLKDELTRFQVFAKVPYLNLGDMWIVTRKNISPEWYSRQTVMKLVQGCGRGVRNEKDYCITYILDGNINNLIYRHGYMFPNWFLDSICT